MLGVFQPDFGYLTDAMTIPSGGVLPISETAVSPSRGRDRVRPA